jgi:DNA/RNA endonuclease YhcR with UshA esterase domain
MRDVIRLQDDALGRRLLLALATAGAAIAVLTATTVAVPAAVAQSSVSCSGAVSWQQASSMVGRVATIVGRVASTKYASSSNGSPTFLDIGRPYPNEGLTVVIWIENRSAFGRPEVRYRGRTICVRGLVANYKGGPEIEARAPSQIAIKP